MKTAKEIVEGKRLPCKCKERYKVGKMRKYESLIEYRTEMKMDNKSDTAEGRKLVEKRRLLKRRRNNWA
jgi:hypothetical protein